MSAQQGRTPAVQTPTERSHSNAGAANRAKPNNGALNDLASALTAQRAIELGHLGKSRQYVPVGSAHAMPADQSRPLFHHRLTVQASPGAVRSPSAIFP